MVRRVENRDACDSRHVVLVEDPNLDASRGGAGESPLWHGILLQRLALETARLRGLDPDAPPNLTKITKTL